MIEIVSLFLGLVSGFHDVELRATGPVARVELRLDGETVSILDGEPWDFLVDFGDALVPHELVAVAYDADGEELDRAGRWVNVLQQPVAEAALAFSADEHGNPRSVGLVWQSIGQSRPLHVEMTFDGRPLEVKDLEQVPLPPYDPRQMHLLSATVYFRAAVSRLDAGFGGVRGAEVASALTAVAVSVDEGAELPPPAGLEGWFVKDGEPLRVQGVEAGAAEVVVVRDPAVQPALEALVARIDGSALGRRASYGRLDKDTHLRVLSPAGAPLAPGGVTPEMFVRSETLDAEADGLLFLTLRRRPQSFAKLFPNAVALAGVQAHASTRRRAVVLLLGSSPTEQDRYPPRAVRDYLRLLHVPFFAWSLTGEPRPEWEGARAVPLDAKDGPDAFREAVEELRASLAAQRVVWLEGAHLPQTIELAPAAAGIRLAGSR